MTAAFNDHTSTTVRMRIKQNTRGAGDGARELAVTCAQQGVLRMARPSAARTAAGLWLHANRFYEARHPEE